jgi:flagellar biosynthetic protein FlhB
MSKQEMKEEMKMYEGDPMVRSRIRGRFRDLLRQNLAATVPKADVIVTNPTHLAVALEYHAGMPEPMVSAMGADEMAAQIRRIAKDYDVPMVENKSLAWALYENTVVGDFIPAAYYEVVANIYSKVMRINEMRRKAEGRSA